MNSRLGTHRTGSAIIPRDFAVLATTIALWAVSVTMADQVTPPRSSTTRYTNYERLTVNLPKAFRNERDIRLYLGVHDGQVLQVWGELEGVERELSVRAGDTEATFVG